MKCALIALLLLLLLACQPTPEKEVIVSHDLIPTDGASEMQSGVYEYQERWDETIDIGVTKVLFCADVLVDDSATHPVYKAERGAFDGELCMQIIELAFGKGEWRENKISREEILSRIEAFQIGEIEGYDYETGEWITTPLEDEEELLAPYMQMLQDAPQQDSYTTLRKEHLDSLTDVTGVIRLESGELVKIMKNELSHGTICFHRYHHNGLIQPERWVIKGDAVAGERPHALEHISISEEEAIDIGNRFVKQIGAEDLRISWAEKARILKEVVIRPDDASAVAEGYYLHYAQAPVGCVANGYRLQNAQRFLNFDDMQALYNANWGQELLDLLVTEEGIVSISWETPINIVGVEQGDIPLLPFALVQDRIRTLIEYGVKGSKYLVADTGNVYVEEVMLSAVLRPVKDDPDHALLQPAWIVRLTTDLSRTLGLYPYFLVIDATDGSLIR